MYSIPFVDNQGNPQTYSSEFDRLYQGEMTGGLMIKQDPIVDFNTGRLYATYDTQEGFLIKMFYFKKEMRIQKRIASKQMFKHYNLFLMTNH